MSNIDQNYLQLKSSIKIEARDKEKINAAIYNKKQNHERLQQYHKLRREERQMINDKLEMQRLREIMLKNNILIFFLKLQIVFLKFFLKI